MADKVLDGSQHQKVMAVADAKLKVVRYVDGEGEDEVRLAVKVGPTHYLLREKVGNSFLLQKCSDWLETEIQTFKKGKAGKASSARIKAKSA